MLHVKSCNVNHNSESVFHYFASAVNSNQSTKCLKQKRSLCYLQLLKPLKSRLGFSVHLLQIVVWCTVTGIYITFMHSSLARLDGIHPGQIHLIIQLLFIINTYHTLEETMHKNSPSRGLINGLKSAKKRREEFTGMRRRL